MLVRDDLPVDTAQLKENRKTTTIMEELVDGLFMRITNRKKVMAENRHIWLLGMDRRLLTNNKIKIYKIYNSV